MKNSLNNKALKNTYSILLYGTLLLFLAKGIQYALLGSYVPLMLFIIIGIVAYMVRTSKKRSSRVIKVWAFLLMLWSIMRLIIGITDNYKELTENQIQENMGILGYALSIGILYVAIYLLNKTRRHQWLDTRFI